MNKNSRRLGFYISFAVLFAAAAVVLRSVALITRLEDNLLYFSDGTLIGISYAVAAVGCVAMFTALFVLERVSLRASFSSPSLILPTGLVGTALIVFAAGQVLFVASYSPEPFFKSLDTPVTILAFVSALLAPLAVIHFFLSFFLTERHKALRAYFSIALILLLATYASFLYFDASAPLNNSAKVIDQMAFLFTAIFFLYEARVSLGREMWRSYSAFGLIAFILTAYASLPEIIFLIVTGNSAAVVPEASVLLLAFSMFILVRLVISARLKADAESPEMAVLRGYAEERERILAEGAKETVEDGTQLTIDDILLSGEDEVGEPEDNVSVAEADKTAEDADAVSETVMPSAEEW